MTNVTRMLMVAMGLFFTVSPSFAQVSNVSVASKNTDVTTTATATTSGGFSIGGFGLSGSRGGSSAVNVGSGVIEKGTQADNISVASENTNIQTTNAQANIGSVVVK